MGYTLEKFASECHATILLGTLVELGDLLHTPFGFDVARAKDGNHHFSLIELTNDFLIENVVTCELLITPDAWLFPHQLSQTILEDAMKLSDPSLFILRDRKVIDMGIADEQVVRGRSLRHWILSLQRNNYEWGLVA